MSALIMNKMLAVIRAGFGRVCGSLASSMASQQPAMAADRNEPATRLSGVMNPGLRLVAEANLVGRSNAARIDGAAATTTASGLAFRCANVVRKAFNDGRSRMPPTAAVKITSKTKPIEPNAT